MFLRRIRAQAKQFQVLVKQFQAFVNAQQERGLFAETESAEEEQLTRDQFNLRKLILIVTESGKLFGLDSAGRCCMLNIGGTMGSTGNQSPN